MNLEHLADLRAKLAAAENERDCGAAAYRRLLANYTKCTAIIQRLRAAGEGK